MFVDRDIWRTTEQVLHGSVRPLFGLFTMKTERNLFGLHGWTDRGFSYERFVLLFRNSLGFFFVDLAEVGSSKAVPVKERSKLYINPCVDPSGQL